MKYLSICSGIEAASVAFDSLGWTPLAFSEIEPFPRAVLAHHYPDTPLHGDFTELRHEPWIADADLLCGGTPCQAFSVAGNRQSLDDDRGNLTLQFVLLANAIDTLRLTAGREPAWILWENVPGVTSTHDNAFGSFLGGLAGNDGAIEPGPRPEPGKSSAFWRWAKDKHIPKWPSAGVVDGPARCVAWRTLDAQHFGLAQRRKRVFVLARGGAGRWAAADALLPIIESSRWHPAPSRGTGEGVAPTISARPTGGGGLGTDFDFDGGLTVFEPGQLKREGGDSRMSSHTAPTLRANMGDNLPAIAHTLHRSEPPMLVRIREGKEGGGKGPLVSEDQSLTPATGNDQVLAYAIQERAVCENPNAGPQGKGWQEGVAFTMEARHHAQSVSSGMQVRRLTPVECARLQGFPDVREILILHVCSDHQKTSASVEEKSPKLQGLAEPAPQSKSTESAAFAESHFSASRPKISKHAEVLVEINFEAGTIKGTTQGRELFASAPIADRERRTFLQTPLGSFAQLVARTISEQRRIQRTSAQSGPDSLMDESGNPAVSVSGNAIMECAKNVEELERIKSTSSMFTTLQAGSDTRKGDLPMTTLCSYVAAAIAGFIPSEMWSENFCIRIEASWDYLDITFRGKPAADGNKYKALGNSWAVPCARYIGERIVAVTKERP